MSSVKVGLRFIEKWKTDLEKQVANYEAENAEKALGDLLFAAVAVAREKGVDAEMALHGACQRAIDTVKEQERR